MTLWGSKLEGKNMDENVILGVTNDKWVTCGMVVFLMVLAHGVVPTLVCIFAIIAKLFQASFMFNDQQYCFEFIRYCFRFSLLYDEITWYSIFHVCMMIITVFSFIDDGQLDGLSYVFSYGYLPHIACVWCACMFSLCVKFLMWLRKGVIVTCQSGST